MLPRSTDRRISHSWSRAGRMRRRASSASMRPVRMRANMRQSQRKDQTGWPNVAGRLPSTKKWLYHAMPYPSTGHAASSAARPVAAARRAQTSEASVPAKCQRRVAAWSAGPGRSPRNPPCSRTPSPPRPRRRCSSPSISLDCLLLLVCGVLC